MNGLNDKILLFDGICNLCNRLVQFIINRDPNSKFRFAALQSNAGQQLLGQFMLPAHKMNSIVYIRDEKCLFKSTAILYVLKDLGGIWKLFYLFIIVPAFIRNMFYKMVSGSRYKLFGKRETCMVPTPEVQDRFLN